MIEEFKQKMNDRDENDLEAFDDLLRLKEFDLSSFPFEIVSEIHMLAEAHKVHPTAILNNMLVALSTASGKHVGLMSKEIGKIIYAAIYHVHLGESGSGKTGSADSIFDDTIEKINWQFNEQNEENMISVDNDPNLQDNERKRKIDKINLASKFMMLNDATPAALIQALRNGALLYHFDEVKKFLNIFCPGEPGDSRDIMSIMTQLFSKRNISTSRITTQFRSVKDGALSFHANGTLSTAHKFFHKTYLEDGTTYRFIFSISEPKEAEIYEKNGVDIRLARPRTDVKKPEAFIKRFDAVYNKYYSSEVPITFNYTEEAQRLKNIICRGILDSYVDVYSRHNKRIRRVMISKIYNFIDKFSLLFYLLGVQDGELAEHSIESMLQDQIGIDSKFLIGKKCIEQAFQYMRFNYNNWLELIAINIKDDGEEVKEIKHTGASKKGSKYVECLIESLGGPGTYSLNQVETAIRTFEKSTAYRIRSLIKEGHPRMIKSDNKIVLI